MKINKLAIILFICTLMSSYIFSQTTYERNTIKVSGTGTVLVTADIANISLSVKTSNKVASLAAQENAIIMKKVQDSIIKLGISPDDIKTESYYLRNETRYSKSEEEINEYQASNTLNITVRQLDSVGKVIDEALNAGANQLSQVSFSVSDTSKAYKLARELAIQKATDSASVLVNQVNRKLGKVLYIEEERDYQESFRLTGNAMLADTASFAKTSTQINPGDTKISITVYTVFEIK